MREVGTCSSYNSQVSQGAEGSGPSPESDRGPTPVTPHNESSQHLSEGASFTRPGKKGGRQSFECPFSGCPKTFVQERACRRHIEEQHSRKPRRPCQGSLNCNTKWIRDDVYRRHLERVHGIKGEEADKLVGRRVKRRPGRNKAFVAFQAVIEPAFREDAFPTENSNIHVEFRLPPVDSTAADISSNQGILNNPAFSSPVGGHHTSPVSENAVEQSILTLTDPYGAVDNVRSESGQTPSPLWTDAAWVLPDASSWPG